MSYALLFSGQGTQHPGMFPWLSEDTGAAAVAAMDAALAAPWRSVLADPQRRHQNGQAQVLVTGSNLAAWSHLAPLLPGLPVVVAGYSVGELAACACAGALTVADAIGLAAQRAACMDQCAQHVSNRSGQGAGLLSVSGMTEDALHAACPTLDCAIRIAPDHAIWGGTDADLQDASACLIAIGAVCKRLDIAVASHTPRMRDAAQAFAAVLGAASWRQPDFPVVLNATAMPVRQATRLRDGLATQIDHTIDWAACMDALAERGVDCVLEIGAGSPLSALWNRRHGGIPARALADFQGPAGAAEWVRSMQA